MTGVDRRCPQCHTFHDYGKCEYPEPPDAPVEEPRPSQSFRDLWAEHSKDEVVGVLYEQTEAAVRAEAAHPATEGLDVERLADALARSEWAEQVSMPASMWGYRGWAERILARLSSPEGQK